MRVVLKNVIHQTLQIYWETIHIWGFAKSQICYLFVIPAKLAYYL